MSQQGHAGDDAKLEHGRIVPFAFERCAPQNRGAIYEGRLVTIPDYETLMLRLLEAIADAADHRLCDVSQRLAETFKLKDDGRRQLLPSGRQPVFRPYSPLQAFERIPR